MKKMDVQKFLEIEKKYNLNYLEIEGINFWQYARFEIWNDMLCKEMLSLNEAHRIGLHVPIKSMLFYFWKSIFSYYLAERRKVDICFLNHERRVFGNGYYDCMYTEKLVEKYPNSIVLEKPYNYKHLQPTRTKNLYYTDWIVIIGNVYQKIHFKLKSAKYRKVVDDIKRQLEMPYQELKDAYQMNVSLERIANKCAERYFLCKIQYPLYEKLLRKFQPKLIVEVCHYGRQCMLVNEVAKKLNIPTIELQHGAISKDVVAYNYEVELEVPQLPTNIFVFSEFWKEFVKMPIPEERIRAVGFPYFDNKVIEYKAIERKDSRKTVLFISQGPIGNQLSQFAVELSKRLDTKEYKIIYKLHPGEYADWKEHYIELANSGIEVIDNYENNMYYFFSQSDIQIGVYSTALYEGIGFGLETYIYNTTYADMDIIEKLIDKGYAKKVSTVEEILTNLKTENRNVTTAGLWEMDSFKNLSREIEKYM